MSDATKLLDEMNERSREVFRLVVESYLETGDPVGSRTLTRSLSEKVSAATVRNVMQDLEYLGLLGSPHVSAGRVPTQIGLRLFVDGLLEVGDLAAADREKIDATLASNTADVAGMLDRVGSALSGVTHGASLVLTPKHEAAIRHIEFVSLGHDRALVVIVFADGHVNNFTDTNRDGQFSYRISSSGGEFGIQYDELHEDEIFSGWLNQPDFLGGFGGFAGKEADGGVPQAGGVVGVGEGGEVGPLRGIARLAAQTFEKGDHLGIAAGAIEGFEHEHEPGLRAVPVRLGG